MEPTRSLTRSVRGSTCLGTLAVALALATVLFMPATARADCMSLLPLFQQGASNAAIAQYTGLSGAQVGACRAELSRPIAVGPAGAPPMGAVGSPPFGAAGRPPMGAAGPPPMGAPGPPPVGSTVKRLK